MALELTPGNGGGGLIESFEAVSPKDLLTFDDLFARDPRLEEMIAEDRIDREPREQFDTPTPAALTPAPTPALLVTAEPAETVVTTVRKTIQDPLAPILGGGGGGGIGRALPLGTAGTRLVAAPSARSPLVTLLVLAAIAGIGYYLYRRYKKGQQA